MSLQNYIKNTGSTQTIIKDSYNRPVFNNINWEADYNGNIANINVDINDNGDDYQIKAKMDNAVLAELLAIPVVRSDLTKRLHNDFPVNRRPIQMMEIPMIKMPMSMPQREKIYVPPTLTPREIIRIKPEKLQPTLKYQPLLRPVNRKLYTKKLGKREANKYKTPLPKTMRVHLTSPSLYTSSRSRGHGLKTRKHKKKKRLTKNIFRHLFQ